MANSVTYPAVKAENISVAYQADPVLVNVDFETPQGVVMGIVGPNGAGKSTLIKAILGLIPTITGESRFFGKPLAESRDRVCYVPQSSSVDWDFPTSVKDVVKMGTYGRLGWLSRPGAKQAEQVEAALAKTDIADLSDRQIGQLSGGQKQRVFVARALVQDPDLYFMDEPFQGIDAKSQQAIVSVLHGLRQAGKTVVIVHHDLSTLAEYCDHVTLLNKSLIAAGPVDTTFTKANIRKAYNVASSDSTFFEAFT